MKRDEDRTREQLIHELAELRQRIAQLEASETERKQIESELRLQSQIVASTAEGVNVSRAPDGVIIYTNRRFEQMFGYGQGELTGKHMSVLNAPGEQSPEGVVEGVVEEVIRSLQEKGVWYGEVHNIKKDGTRFWTRATVSTFEHSMHGNVWVAVQQDITERKQAEEQLHRANRALQVLSECNQAVIRATREWDLLHQICRIIVDAGGYRLAWVGYAEQNEEKTVRPVAEAGYDEGYLETLRITWADTERGRGPTGTAIRTGKTSIMRSILTNPSYGPWRAEATRQGYASSIALPLIASGQTLGALNIYSAEPDAFDGDEAKLLMELADDLAYGVMALRAGAKQKRAEQALLESEQRFRSIVEQSQDGVSLTDEQGAITEWNPSQERITGLKRSEVLGRPMWDIMSQMTPDNEQNHAAYDQMKAQFLELCRTGQAPWLNQLEEGTIRRSDGTRRVVQDMIFPVKTDKGFMVGVVSRDITQRKKAEGEIEQSLREKEVLLREINHRVKNNIQVISSLLALQSRHSRDEHTVQMFKDSQGRVDSIALVHEKLYQSQDLANIDFADYVRSLADALFNAYMVNSSILTLEINAEDVALDVNTAIPCGLIVNELVSNCLKHAFPNGRQGTIRIELHSHKDDKLTLIVSDNGIGFPAPDFTNAQTLGLQLVATLVRQLRGTIELDRNGETTFRITFQKAEV